MRTYSTAGADLTHEYGIEIGRWAQYPGAQDLPFGAMWCVIPPGGHSHEDCHPEVELAVVVSGTARFELPADPESSADAPLGTAVLLDPNERHVYHNASQDAPLVLLSLYWMPEGGPHTADGD